MSELAEEVLEDVERRRHRKNPFDAKYLRFAQASFSEVPSRCWYLIPKTSLSI